MVDGTRQQVDDVSVSSRECTMCRWLARRAMMIEVKLLAMREELGAIVEASAEHERLIHAEDLDNPVEEEEWMGVVP